MEIFIKTQTEILILNIIINLRFKNYKNFKIFWIEKYNRLIKKKRKSLNLKKINK